MNWLVVELGITVVLGAELLERSIAHRTVPDSVTWDHVVGFSNIRALAPLTYRDKAAVLKAAKVGAKTVKTILRERGLVAASPQLAKSDVVLLAEYIASLDGVPKDITDIVHKYIARTTRRIALRKSA